jgi:hypothetical protein
VQVRHTITGSEQTCKSTGGLLAGRKITCTGSASVVRGELSLSIIDTDGNLSGNYKLNATISAKKGEAKAYVSTTGGKEGEKVSPGEPLCISAVVGLDEDEEEVSVNLKVWAKRSRTYATRPRCLRNSRAGSRTGLATGKRTHTESVRMGSADILEPSQSSFPRKRQSTTRGRASRAKVHFVAQLAFTRTWYQTGILTSR